MAARNGSIASRGPARKAALRSGSTPFRGGHPASGAVQAFQFQGGKGWCGALSVIVDPTRHGRLRRSFSGRDVVEAMAVYDQAG